MRRHRLICLERLGLVMEMADCGYSRSFTSDGVAPIPSSGDPIEDEKLRIYMMRKARETELARARRAARLRKLARMDFKMVGGVAPIGFQGGAGGGDGFSRPGSITART